MTQVHDQKRKELKALLESALQNFSTLENQLRNQLMHNADQVFFVQNGDGEKFDEQSKNLLEALNTVDKAFPQENGS